MNAIVHPADTLGNLVKAHFPQTRQSVSPAAQPLAELGPMPSTNGGKVIWAKSLMIEAARVWAETINLRAGASAEEIAAGGDECADIRDAFLTCAKHFTRALDGDYRALEPFFSDGISDGLEGPLKLRLADLDEDGDSNAEHRIGAATQGVGRRR